MTIAKSIEAPPVLVEFFNEHWYKVVVADVTYYLASVTTKLGIMDKPFLALWRGDIGNREADMRLYEAGQRGKRIHWAWEVALNGGAVVFDPWQAPIYTPDGIATLKAKYGDVAIIRTQEEMWQIVKLQRQFDILKPMVIGVEEKLYDLDTKDAGTADGVYSLLEGEYMVNGSKPLRIAKGIYINDLKTGSQVQDEAYCQTAKYLSMYEKKNAIKLAGTLITHTSAKTKGGIAGLATYLRTREQVMDEDLPMYNKIAAVWDARHKDAKPQTYEFPSLIKLSLKETS